MPHSYLRALKHSCPKLRGRVLNQAALDRKKDVKRPYFRKGKRIFCWWPRNFDSIFTRNIGIKHSFQVTIVFSCPLSWPENRISRVTSQRPHRTTAHGIQFSVLYHFPFLPVCERGVRRDGRLMKTFKHWTDAQQQHCNPTCSPPLARDVEELYSQVLRPVNSLLKDISKIKSKIKEEIM